MPTCLPTPRAPTGPAASAGPRHARNNDAARDLPGPEGLVQRRIAVANPAPRTPQDCVPWRRWDVQEHPLGEAYSSYPLQPEVDTGQLIGRGGRPWALRTEGRPGQWSLDCEGRHYQEHAGDLGQPRLDQVRERCLRAREPWKKIFGNRSARRVSLSTLRSEVED